VIKFLLPVEERTGSKYGRASLYVVCITTRDVTWLPVGEGFYFGGAELRRTDNLNLGFNRCQGTRI